MANNIPISGLNGLAIITSDDFIPIVDSGSLTTFKATISVLGDWISASGSASSSFVSISSSYAKSSSYSLSSSFAISSSFSTTSSFAVSSSFSTNASFAVSSSFSTTASFSISSSFSTIAFSSTSASYANTISTTAVSASWASRSLQSTTAVSASWASQSISASFALSVGTLPGSIDTSFTTSYVIPTVTNGGWSGKLQKFPYNTWLVVNPQGVTAYSGSLYVIQQNVSSAYYNVLKINMVTNVVTIQHSIQLSNYSDLTSQKYNLIYSQGMVTGSALDGINWYVIGLYGAWRIPIGDTAGKVVRISNNSNTTYQEPPIWDDNFCGYKIVYMDFNVPLSASKEKPTLYCIGNSFYTAPDGDTETKSDDIVGFKLTWNSTIRAQGRYSSSFTTKATGAGQKKVDLSVINNNSFLKQMAHFAVGTSGPMEVFRLIHAGYNHIKNCYYMIDAVSGLLHVIDQTTGNFSSSFTSSALTYTRSLAIPWPPNGAPLKKTIGDSFGTQLLNPQLSVIFNLSTGQEEGITFYNNCEPIPGTTSYLGRVGYINWPEF